MKRPYLLLPALALAVSLSASTYSQAPPPKQSLSDYEQRPGVVIVDGYTRIGTITNAHGATLDVEAEQYADTTGGAKLYGLSLTITEAQTGHTTNSTLVDYDEIAPLVAGLETLGKLTDKSTSLQHFRASYKTRSGFLIFEETGSIFLDKVYDDVQGRATNGTTRLSSLPLDLPDLAKLKELCIAAKELIDSKQK